jgi:anion-transporting  ArsA/GET3 family ATPase
MNVQITLTVDLDEIPSKCAVLLDERMNEAVKHIDYTRASVNNSLHNGTAPTAQMVAEIDQLRKTLYLLDARLGETERMLAGYIQQKLPTVANPSQRELLTEGPNGEEG